MPSFPGPSCPTLSNSTSFSGQYAPSKSHIPLSTSRPPLPGPYPAPGPHHDIVQLDTIRVANSRPGIGHTPPLLMHSHQLFFFSADATAATTTSLFVHITGHGKSRHITHLPISPSHPPDTLLTYVGSQWPTLFLLWPSPAKHPYCWPLL